MQIARTLKEFVKFRNKNLGEYYGLYVQSDTLLLPNVFENLQNMCIEIYEHDHAKNFSAPGSACDGSKVKLDL